MTTINDPGPRELLEQPNFAVVSTHDENGTIHNSVIWVNAENGHVAINSAVGRKWPTNLERDPRVNLLVYDSNDPYHYLEIRGHAEPDREQADEHINALTRKYMNQDEYPFRQPGEQRIKFVVKPERVRYVKQS